MSRVPLHPVRWDAPKAPPRAREREGRDLFPPARLIPLPAPSEDVVSDAGGHLLCGLNGGAIVRLEPSSGRVESLADTGGRPLGLQLTPAGDLLICDSHRGLLRLDLKTRVLETLVREVEGHPLVFCSNAAARSDGTIWFTESTSRFGFEDYLGDILEHGGAGRLFRREPNGNVEVVLTGLQFANGLKLTTDESALILAETGGYSLSRVPIAGAGAGQRQLIAENLPGMPDNLSRNAAGNFWVAMVTPRNPLLDVLSGWPHLRSVAWRIPAALRPKPARTVWVMQVDVHGNVLRDLQQQRDDFYFTTGVAEASGRLYLASTEIPALLELELGID